MWDLARRLEGQDGRDRHAALLPWGPNQCPSERTGRTSPTTWVATCSRRYTPTPTGRRWRGEGRKTLAGFIQQELVVRRGLPRPPQDVAHPAPDQVPGYPRRG